MNGKCDESTGAYRERMFSIECSIPFKALYREYDPSQQNTHKWDNLSDVFQIRNELISNENNDNNNNNNNNNNNYSENRGITASIVNKTQVAYNYDSYDKNNAKNRIYNNGGLPLMNDRVTIQIWNEPLIQLSKNARINTKVEFIFDIHTHYIYKRLICMLVDCSQLGSIMIAGTGNEKKKGEYDRQMTLQTRTFKDEIEKFDSEQFQEAISAIKKSRNVFPSRPPNNHKLSAQTQFSKTEERIKEMIGHVVFIVNNEKKKEHWKEQMKGRGSGKNGNVLQKDIEACPTFNSMYDVTCLFKVGPMNQIATQADKKSNKRYKTDTAMGVFCIVPATGDYYLRYVAHVIGYVIWYLACYICVVLCTVCCFAYDNNK